MRGERTAARYVQRLGYKVLEANVRLGKDEIDLVAFDPTDQVMVFIEVKTRAKLHEDYRPELNLDFRKRRMLRRSARRWVAWQHYEGGYRIDLICVAEGRVTDHIKELEWD
jgi:putative endonuclease